MSALPSPDALPAAVAAPLNLQAPRLIRRMACWLYEGILMFGVVFIAGYLFGTLSQTRNAWTTATRCRVPVCGVWHLFHLVLGQGPDAGHEDLAHPCVDRHGRRSRSARTAALRAVLAVVPAAPGRYWHLRCRPLKCWCSYWAGSPMWAILSRFHPAAAVLARRTGGHTPGAF
jgi:hypothetical protein